MSFRTQLNKTATASAKRKREKEAAIRQKEKSALQEKLDKTIQKADAAMKVAAAKGEFSHDVPVDFEIESAIESHYRSLGFEAMQNGSDFNIVISVSWR